MDAAMPAKTGRGALRPDGIRRGRAGNRRSGGPVGLTAANAPPKHRDGRFAVDDRATANGIPHLAATVPNFLCHLADRHGLGAHPILISRVSDVTSSANSPLIHTDNGFRSFTAA